MQKLHSVNYIYSHLSSQRLCLSLFTLSKDESPQSEKKKLAQEFEDNIYKYLLSLNNPTPKMENKNLPI